MKVNRHSRLYSIGILFLILVITQSCSLPSPDEKKKTLRVKHNYIVLLDLSDRLIVQENQPERTSRS